MKEKEDTQNTKSNQTDSSALFQIKHSLAVGFGVTMASYLGINIASNSSIIPYTSEAFNTLVTFAVAHPYLVPFIVGMVTAVGVYGAYQIFTDKISSAQINKINLKLTESQIQNIKIKKEKKLMLQHINLDLVKVVAQEINKENFQNNGKKSEISTLEINLKSASTDSYSQLLGTEIGQFDTKHLSLINAETSVANDLLTILSKSISNGAFRSLKTLDLSHNNIEIDYNSIKSLSAIGQKVKIKKLVLSGNAIGIHGVDQAVHNFWYGFLSNLHKHFPCLETLEIRHARLQDSDIALLQLILNSVTNIKTLDISNNQLTRKGVKQLIHSDDLKKNLTIQNFIADFSSSFKNKVTEALLQRKEALSRLYSELALDDAQPLNLSILDKLSSSKKDAAAESLRHYFSALLPNSVDVSQEVKKWVTLSHQLQPYKRGENLSLPDFQRALKELPQVKLPSQEEIIIQDAVDSLTNEDATIDLIFNQDKGISLTNDNLSKIVNGLSMLYEKKSEKQINMIEFNGVKITENGLSDLLNMGLGLYGTKTLSLANNHLGDDALVYLADLKDSNFSNLRHLDLSGNKFTIQGMKTLVEFCKNRKIQSLNISNNNLNPTAETDSINDFTIFLNHISNLSYLERVDFSNTGISADNVHLFETLLSRISSIKTIDLTQNHLHDPRPFRKLIDNPRFQSNLPLENVIMGYRDVNLIEALKNKRKNIESFRNSLSVEEKKAPLLFVLINRFLKDFENPNIPDEIKALLQNRPSDRASFWERLRLMAHDFREHVEINETVYHGYKQRKSTSNAIFVLNKLLSVEKAKGESDIELKINEPSSPFGVEGPFFIKEMQEMLLRTNERKKHPALSSLSLNKIDLTTSDFVTLMEAGLDDYHIKSLTLSHNRLGDEFVKFLLESKDKKCFSTLKHLDLSNNQISASGLSELSKFCNHVGLESLVLNNNPIISKENDAELFGQWASRLYRSNERLKSLEIQEIGLKRQENLLGPLLTSPSLTRRIDVGNLLVANLAKVMNHPGFLMNFGLTIQGRSSSSATVKKILDKKKKMLLSLKKKGFETMFDLPFVCQLLSWLMSNDVKQFPEDFDNYLNSKPDDVLLTYKDQYLSLARHLQYFRDRAKLRNPEFIYPSFVSEKEYIAMVNGQLNNFWLMAKESNENRLVIPKISSAYEPSSLGELKSLVLYNDQVNSICILLCEDDSIRVVSLKTNQQFILSRYQEALKCGQNQTVLIFNYGNVGVLVNNDADVFVLEKNAMKFSVSNGSLPFIAGNKYVDFFSKNFAVVTDPELLTAPDVMERIPVHTPQLTQRLSSALNAPSSAANDSCDVAEPNKRNTL